MPSKAAVKTVLTQSLNTPATRMGLSRRRAILVECDQRRTPLVLGRACASVSGASMTTGQIIDLYCADAALAAAIIYLIAAILALFSR